MEDQLMYEQFNMAQQLNSSPDYIKLRLDTRELITKDVFDFLTATRDVEDIDEKTGETVIKRKKLGDAIANEKGVEALIGMMRLHANNHSVLGNMKKDEFINFMADVREDLTRAIVINSHDWEISDDKLNMLINTFMTFFHMFASRTVDNLERSGLTGFKVDYRQQQQERKSGLRSFTEGLGGA